MSRTTTKLDLARDIIAETGIDRATALRAIDCLHNSIVQRLTEPGSTIQIRGFGTWKVRTKRSRTAHNPKTGEKVVVPERDLIVFKPSVEVRDRLIAVRQRYRQVLPPPPAPPMPHIY